MISNFLPAASHENMVVGSKSNPICGFFGLGASIISSQAFCAASHRCARVFHVVVEKGICFLVVVVLGCFFFALFVDPPAFPTSLSMFAYISASRVLPQI